ncbi:DUF3718 domain-containing protein [Neptunicella marina]|uniref:DUF3718 domain-containing protein n=1 Tax=Neptunicella marina TaxID=2125989 RepID=A0A8J6M108_9ALTE|nr:DUF3718 domain-containing protein [Neptunicella marina]MBC3767915.1 DUF3718 domain-containing protein [Neptunicella marina]
MKKLLTIATLSTVLAAPFAFADVNEDLQNICTIVKNNDKGELRKKMRGVQKDYKLRLGDFYGGVSCGGNSLIRYSMQNDAVDVGTYMIKKMSKKDLSQAESDGLAIKDWASQNGYLDSEIGKELIDRLN